ncbi:MAG: TROVE domain-containing protein [Micropruina sp.]|nr:TROVE domain-containing protein [Micropruina sp.]
MDILRAFNLRRTPQSQPADARQQPNSAGGYTFVLDDAARLRRFLTLGTDGATYYTSAHELTRQNAECVVRMAETDHATLVRTLVDVSLRGAAPKVNPTLFALAIAASIGTDEEKREALAVLPQVVRTGTHLFLFAGYVEQFRGWGRGLRRAVASWYADRDVDALAYQAVKYRQREGWSHRDLLRLAHPVTTEDARRALFDWIVRGSVGDGTPRLIEGFLKASEPDADVAALVGEYGLSWEMLPDAALAEPGVWEALLAKGMPQTALMRQLPRLTNLGLLPPLGGWTSRVAEQLRDPERLRKARVHPVNVLIAQRTYASGRGARGSGTWTPTPAVVDALDAAFFAAFGAVEPSGKRTFLGLDVSGSMTVPISNLPISAREASAALALVQLATEPEAAAFGFTGGWPATAINPLSISPRQRLDDVLSYVSGLAFGRTDCALPMLYARDKGLEVDTFVVYTDNETWFGDVHPHQALREYREASGIDAKLVVVGMTATNFSIADPDDAGMLDVAGFDQAVPNLIAEFSRGL